jgi:hypothetical protein
VRATEFIKDLQEHVETYGDLEVVGPDDEPLTVSYSAGEDQDENDEDYDEDAAEDKFVIE